MGARRLGQFGVAVLVVAVLSGCASSSGWSDYRSDLAGGDVGSRDDATAEVGFDPDRDDAFEAAPRPPPPPPPLSPLPRPESAPPYEAGLPADPEVTGEAPSDDELLFDEAWEDSDWEDFDDALPATDEEGAAFSSSGHRLRMPVEVDSEEGGDSASEEHSLDTGEELERAYDALPWGRIAFEPKRRMRQGIQETVVVRISRNEAADILAGLLAQGPARDDGSGSEDAVRVEPIKVSGAMEVELIAKAAAFEIQPSRPQRQAIVGDFVDFSWFVTPLMAGRHELRLEVRAEIPTSAGLKEPRLEVKEPKIEVEVNPGFIAQRFWSNNWQWVMGSPVVLGLFGWVARRLKTRRNHSSASSRSTD